MKFTSQNVHDAYDAGGPRAIAIDELGRVESAVEFVDAGHIATSPAKVAVALRYVEVRDE